MMGSAVSEPWPISAAGDMMDTVPSACSVTHGFTTTSFPRAACDCAAARFSAPGTPSDTPKVNPAAPSMKRRRPSFLIPEHA